MFKSYVFVRITEADKTSIRMINGVVNFVYWLGKPAIIKDREIETIKRFLSEYEDVEVLAVALEPDTRVRIRYGVFMDKEGIVTKVMRNKVQVMINSIGYVLTAVIPSKRVTVIKKV